MLLFFLAHSLRHCLRRYRTPQVKQEEKWLTAVSEAVSEAVREIRQLPLRLIRQLPLPNALKDALKDTDGHYLAWMLVVVVACLLLAWPVNSYNLLPVCVCVCARARVCVYMLLSVENPLSSFSGIDVTVAHAHAYARTYKSAQGDFAYLSPRNHLARAA